MYHRFSLNHVFQLKPAHPQCQRLQENPTTQHYQPLGATIYNEHECGGAGLTKSNILTGKVFNKLAYFGNTLLFQPLGPHKLFPLI